MSTNSYKMKAGKLILSLGGDTFMDCTAQLTSCKVTPSESVESTDAIPTLDGGEIPAEEEVTTEWVLEGTLLQDLAVAGIIEWSWSHAAEWATFVFVPEIATDRGVTGQVRVGALAIGGDVTKPATRPTSDFSWKARGPAAVANPVFGVYDPIGFDVTEDV